MLHMTTRRSFFSIGLLLLGALFLSGCGKDEAAGGFIGTASGAAIGAAVAGRHDAGVGAVIGGLAGGLVGSSIGRSSDEEREDRDREQAARAQSRREAVRQHELDRIRDENRRLRQKWCGNCNRQVNLTDARSCPSCGGELIRERYCRECGQTFSPASGYRYCPNCRPGTALRSR